MPPLAAVGASIAAAASAVTLTGLATGAAIVGTGMQLVGMATGSKTLQKIGTGFSMAGGLGLAANSAKGLMSAKSVTGGAKSSGLLAADNIDDMLSTPIKGSSNMEGLKAFNAPKSQLSSMDSFKGNADKIGGVPTVGSSMNAGFDPELEKSYFQRANETLTKYNPYMNIAGGMGEAYMMNERMDLERELLDKRLGIEQQLIDRTTRNNSTPLNIDPTINLTRNVGAYTPLLRGQ